VRVCGGSASGSARRAERVQGTLESGHGRGIHHQTQAGQTPIVWTGQTRSAATTSPPPSVEHANRAARTANDDEPLLHGIFLDKTPELERYNVVSLYCVVSELMKQFVIEEIKPYLHDWFITFEQTRRDQEQKSQDEADPGWIFYKEKISHSTDAADSIRARMEFMLEDLLKKYPTLSRKDNQRIFTDAQRLAVFRRDNGFCQLRIKCDDHKLVWDDWHCDHVKPWSSGGQTTVANAQAAYTACNLAKGANEVVMG